MINNAFASINSIFSEISNQNSFTTLWKNENETKDKIEILSQQIIVMLIFPHEKELKASNFIKLKNKIVQLRNSPLGKNNYANCEGAIQKIEQALNNYGKKIYIGHKTINNCLKKDQKALLGLNILIETLKENETDKTDLSLLYKLQNLSILIHPKELSILVNMLHKAPDKLQYIDLILKYLENDLSELVLSKLNERQDGGFDLLSNASSVFDLHSFNSVELTNSESRINKLLILKVMALFIDVDQEVDLQLFIHLLSNKTLNKTESDLLKTLTRIPREKRMPSLQHASKFFTSNLGIWEKFTYILEVSLSVGSKGDPLKIATFFKNLSLSSYFISIENASEIPADSKFRQEIVMDSMQIHYSSKGYNTTTAINIYYDHFEKYHNKMGCRTLNTMLKIQIPKEQRDRRLLEINKASSLNGIELARALYTLSQTSDDGDMRDTMQCIHRLIKEKIIDITNNDSLLQPYRLIASLPIEDRDEVIDFVIKASNLKYFKELYERLVFRDIPVFEKHHLITVASLLNEKEKKLLMEILSNGTFIFDHFPFILSKNFAIEISLFLMNITSNEECLEQLRTGNLKNALTLESYIEQILISAGQKISHLESCSKEALMELCHYIYNNHMDLHLFQEHPLLGKAIEMLSVENLQGLKNPFLLHKKLVDLSKQPISFKPQPVVIANKTFLLNMKGFADMSLNIAVSREDVPKEATLSAFNLIFSNLVSKHESHRKKFNDALHDMNPDLSWTSLTEENTLISLRGLLSLTGDNVNEIEAKWRKVLANILSKSTEKRKGSFFTEQEMVHVTTQYVIQACAIGINGGIEDAYQSLPSSFKYKGNNLSLKSNDDLFLELKQKAALDFLNKLRAQNIDASVETLSLLLIKESLHDSKTILELLPALIGYDLSLWDITSSDPEFSDDPIDDPFAEWHLTRKGAESAMHIALKTKENVCETLFPILRDFLDRIFNRGNDTVIKHFIEGIEIKQGVHQSLYIKNLIGHVVGLSKYISPDPYGAHIYKELTNASVNEVLEVFFDKHQPEHFVKEVMRVINQDPKAYKQALSAYFDKREFWDAEDNLTLDGALELFIRAELMIDQ